MSRYPHKEYLSEDFINNNFLREIEPIVKSFPGGAVNKIRQGEFTCLHCSKIFVAPLACAKRTQRKCCSYACTHQYNHEVNLGTEEHYLYTRWQGMRQRCLCTTSSNYPNYGGRGIALDSRFDDFAQYVSIVESLPSFPGKAEVIKYGYQLDREDNSKGYAPENLRWISPSGNTANRRKTLRKTSSDFIGISYQSGKAHQKNPWAVHINADSKTIFRKMFATERDAVIARDEYILSHGLPHTLNILTRNATTIENTL